MNPMPDGTSEPFDILYVQPPEFHCEERRDAATPAGGSPR